MIEAAHSARWLPAFFLAALLLPPLPVGFGEGNLHPALAVAALGVAAGVLKLGEWRFSADLLNLALLAFFSVLVASLGPAVIYAGLDVAAASAARVALFGISVYVFFYARHGPRAEGGGSARGTLRLLLGAAVAAALFACLDFHFQFPAPANFGAQFLWLSSGVYRRAQGLFYEASTLGNFCVFFLVMIAAQLARAKEERVAPGGVLLACGVPLGTALVLSYSRASLVSLAVSMSVLLVMCRARWRVGRLAAWSLATAAVFEVLTYAVFPTFATAYWTRLRASAEYAFSAPEVALSGRVASWEALGDFLAAQPWHAVVGIGYKTLPYSDFVGQAVVADNMYLSLLVETGVLGLGALLLWCGAALAASYMAARSGEGERSFFGVWFFCFWSGQMVQMMSGDLLTYWRVLPLYFWVLAMAVREPRGA